MATIETTENNIIKKLENDINKFINGGKNGEWLQRSLYFFINKYNLIKINNIYVKKINKNDLINIFELLQNYINQEINKQKHNRNSNYYNYLIEINKLAQKYYDMNFIQIMKEFVDKSENVYGAKSKVNEGSLFWFTVPIDNNPKINQQKVTL